jgi:DNA primase
MIPPKQVDEIREAARVEEVVGDYVNLKRRGSNMIGLCPFHNEKTPSFSVSPSKGIYKCFGCGKAGDSVKFLMEHDNLSYPDALRQLAAKYGIQIEEREVSNEERQAMQRVDSLFILNEFAKDFYQKQLLETDRGRSVGLSYFRDRGISEASVEKFGLGYAPDGYKAFFDAATQAGFAPEMIRELGLCSEKEFDFFRNRVMFTIHNLSSKPVAFAGRIMGKDPKAPKYINSPETEIYFKSKVLYGANFAKQAIRKYDECMLVEGYTDVISMHQEGIEQVVASSGTSLTVEQVRLIRRFTQNLLIIYDGDAAGVNAALRGLDIALEHDLNVKVLLLSEGDDPDSYVRRVGGEQMLEYIRANARDFILFKTSRLMEEVAGDPIKRSALIKDVVASISLIPDPLKRSAYIQDCSRVMEFDETLLIEEMNAAIRQRLKKQQQQRDREQPPAPSGDDWPDSIPPPGAEEIVGEVRSIKHDYAQEREVAGILVQAADQYMDLDELETVAKYVIANIEELIDAFDHPLYGKIARISMDRLLDKLPLNPAFFIGHSDPEISAFAVDACMVRDEYSTGWEERFDIRLNQKLPEQNFVHHARSAIRFLKLRKFEKLFHQVLERLKESQAAGDYEQTLRLLEVYKELREQGDIPISKELGTVIRPKWH